MQLKKSIRSKQRNQNRKRRFYARDVDEDYWEFPHAKPTMYCEANSAAHKYALRNKYPYKLYDTTNEIQATTLNRQATHYNGATLKWKALSNVSGYRIYRSTTGKDGSWTALKNVSGATGYQLWRATSPYGTYKRIQVSRTTTAKDTTSKKGKTYYYKIRAYRKVNNKYVYSKCTDIRKLTRK